MSTEPWQVEINATACSGSALCVSIAPDHFTLDDGISRPVRTEVAPDDAVLDAAQSCPMMAILVRDGTGAVLAP